MQIVSFRAAEDAFVRFIATRRLFAVGAGARSCLRIQRKVTKCLLRLAAPVGRNNAPLSKRALLIMGAAICVVSFCITLVLLPE